MAEFEQQAVAPASTWRLTPHARESLAFAYGRTLGLRALAWLTWVGGVAFYLFGVRPVLAQGGDAALLAGVKALAMMAASQWALAILYRRLRDHVDIGPGIRRIQTKVPDEGACRARVSVCQNRVVLGEDEGYLWFEGGTLFYKGLQTVFRLNRPDVASLEAWSRRDRETNDPNVASDRSLLVLAADRRSVVAEFVEPFDEHEARARIAAFRRRLAAWLLGEEPAYLESLLPPRGLHPALAAVQPFCHEPLFAFGLMAASYAALGILTPHDFRPGAGMAATVLDAGLAVLAAMAVAAAWSHRRARSVREAAMAEQAQSLEGR